MEITTIEARVLEQMMSKIESIAGRVEILYRNNNDKSLQKWLDSQEVCQILNVSKRQLQTYRENGTVAYSQVNHKILYRSQDIQTLILKNTHKSSWQK